MVYNRYTAVPVTIEDYDSTLGLTVGEDVFSGLASPGNLDVSSCSELDAKARGWGSNTITSASGNAVFEASAGLYDLPESFASKPFR